MDLNKLKCLYVSRHSNLQQTNAVTRSMFIIMSSMLIMFKVPALFYEIDNFCMLLQIFPESDKLRFLEGDTLIRKYVFSNISIYYL